MKKVLAMLLASAMVVSMTACGGNDNTNTQEPAAEDSTEAPAEGEDASNDAAAPSGDTYRAALLLNGTLGDKSFYDSANEGLTRLRDELGADVFDFKVEQMGGTAADESKWEPTLLDYCDSGEYDVIIMGTWQMADPLAKAAEQYPDQKFMFFDEQFDFEGNGNPQNIYNILYKQNEVSYLVGAAAAMMTTDETIEGIDPSTKKIGFLGGMDNAVINDFLKGYEQGAKDVDPEVEVVIGWVGDFVDSTKGKDIALGQYQSGVDVGYNVAGNAGLGQIEAAGDTNLYAFGVDSDQAALLPDYAKNIPTSALKNVGNSLYRAINLDLEGKLEYGTTEVLGFAEGGVELVKDAHYEEMLPENIRTTLDEMEQKIINGEIVVDTAIER
ncbi:MAG: BMP family ABC transporter substrate-binding protein [Lachnospiraceae bacterium]|nr:BMP family ABC transporter substrate-binding protein [Lachnospiraceae bacterium]